MQKSELNYHNVKSIKMNSTIFDWKRSLVNFICIMFRINRGESKVETKKVPKILIEGAEFVWDWEKLSPYDEIKYMPPYAHLPMKAYATKKNKGKWKYLDPETKKLAMSGMGTDGKRHRSKGAL